MTIDIYICIYLNLYMLKNPKDDLLLLHDLIGLECNLHTIEIDNDDNET